MAKASFGLLIYRRAASARDEPLRVLLVHPGGPFFKQRDAGFWTVPKGMPEHPSEEPLTVARREFTEETSWEAPEGPYALLGTIRQKGGKVVTCWAAEGTYDLANLRSNLFELDWPPRSGRRERFPEIDRAAWFTPAEACHKINAAQRPFVTRLQNLLDESGFPTRA